MELLFLGTGSAWTVPEFGCECKICERMRHLDERRTRSSLFIRGQENILVDCGPDIREHMTRFELPLMDAVLITHEHGDHFLGLDELLSYRRSVPREAWRPIPAFATRETWEAVETRFGYLVGSLLEKKIALPGRRLEGLSSEIVPFKTFHGDIPRGSVGYVVRYGPQQSKKIVYTSDFDSVQGEDELLSGADVLVIQAHWFNEPERNRPHHMSFQRAIDFIKQWAPIGKTFITHISDGDWVEGDPANSCLKKTPPKDPLKNPRTGTPYPVPRCQAEWDQTLAGIVDDFRLGLPVSAAYDGLSIPL